MTNSTEQQVQAKKKLTKKDFSSPNEVKWCPGCGDYAILAAAQMSMAKIGVEPHNVVVVSGIGCSSRFPYYMSTYGLHTIHGRAPTFATGIKIQNPELSVWLITGDGDGLSIGGNHLAHILRRNLDVNIILFNNEIYGLTKGQYSPTSKEGIKTKSTPMGAIDHPFDPMSFALGCGATFFARTMDTDPKHMMEVFEKAHQHKGTSIIEVFQNCIIFNDNVHEEYTSRKTRKDTCVFVDENNTSLKFGQESDKFIGLNTKTLSLEVSDQENQSFSYDASNLSHAKLISSLKTPMPMGVLYQNDQKSCYEDDLHEQLNQAKSLSKRSGIRDLLFDKNTWQVQ